MASPESLQLQSRVGDIVAHDLRAARVFGQFGVDFCCGGGKTIAAACAERGIDADGVLAELRSALSDDDPAAVDWTTEPFDRLITHLLRTYHQPLHTDMPRLSALAAKVAGVHGETDPRLKRVRDAYEELRYELDMHLAKEEQILFPLILAGRGPEATCPIQVMEHDHEVAGELLRELRALTDGYAPPAHACASWRALLHGLDTMERDLHDHIHLENNVLHPRALKG